MKYSIIIPAKNEEKNLPSLFSQLKSSLKNIKGDLEVILVDDGSADNSFAVARNEQKNFPILKGIRLRKNLGKSQALLAGFNVAQGKILITLDADLQDDPNEINLLIDEINKGYDLVTGWRVTRADNLSKKVSSFLFNWLVNKAIGIHLHDYNCGLKAYKKEVVENLTLAGGMHRFIPVLAALQGYKVKEVQVTNRFRKYGESKYGLGRVPKSLLDLITIVFLQKYAQRPLRLFGVVGVFFLALGILTGVYLTVLRLQGEKIGDRPLLILAVLLIVLGVQFFSLGLIGEMIATNKKNSLSIAEKI